MINKKAQVSLEMILILAIVILGAVILGVYYISTVNKRIADADIASEIDDIYASGPTTPNIIENNNIYKYEIYNNKSLLSY